MPKIIDTLPDYFFYLEHQRQVTHGTLLTYKQTLQEFCSLYGLKDTHSLLWTHIIKFKNLLATRPCKRKDQKWLKHGTICSTMIRLKSYVKWLSERGHLSNLAASDVPINKTILRNPTYLTSEEMKLILEELDLGLKDVLFRKKKRDYKYAAFMIRAVVHMLYATGLRNAELRLLKPTDINMEYMRWIVLGKGWKYNNFTFNIQAREALQDFLTFKKRHYAQSSRHMEYIFTSANFGTPITATGLNRALKELGERVGLNKRLTAHVFRHTTATTLLNNGANIREVQEKLRHVNLDTTALYTHVTITRLSEITQGLEL